MKIILSLLLLLFFGFTAQSKNDTLITYHTYDGQKCKKRKARYMMKSYPMEDGRFGVEEIKLSGEYIEKAVYKSKEMLVKDGAFESYFWSGKVESKGTYRNNRREGEWTFYLNGFNMKSRGTFEKGLKSGEWEYFDENGRLRKKCNYSKGELNGNYERWEGRQKTEKGFYEENKEIGDWMGWHANGKIAYKGAFEVGVRTGEWLHYYSSGQIFSKAIFVTSSQIERTFFDEQGNEVEFEGEKITEASYTGGELAMMDYIRNNVMYPELARKQGEQGIVYLQFTVMRDGSLADVEIRLGVSETIDAEAIRLTKAMPDWQPAKLFGFRIRTRYTLPIHFRLG